MVPRQQASEYARRRDAIGNRSDTRVARLGGDEFVVVVLDRKNQDLDRVGEDTGALRTATAEPLSASIGVAIFPFCGTDAETLVRHADHAMYAAKNARKQGCHVCPDFLPNVVPHSLPLT